MLRTLLSLLALAPGVTLTDTGGTRVLAVDRTQAQLRVLHAGVPGLARPDVLARRGRAVAGVNGGYFAGADGDPTGVVVDHGRVLSEPVGARTALLVPSDPAVPARVAPVRWAARLTTPDGRRLVDGVNRTRGRIPACGGRGGDQPTQRIDTARVCTDASELVALTPEFGRRARPRTGVEAVVRDDAVTRVGRPTAARIPADGYVLSGSGDAARLLADLRPGDPVQLTFGDAADYDVVLGGAPRLVREGRVRVTAAREGRGADTARVPRTVAGVRADGTVLLITVDAATLTEAARIAIAHGAEQALSLDSGSSTAMVPGSAPQRAVANGLFAFARDG